jgi:hypothetical protein
MLSVLRVQAITERPISMAGRLELGTSGYQISVRRGTPWRRQRFTVAHEIGHILILNALAGDRDGLQALRSSQAYQPIERLCNRAAAELLLPADTFDFSARNLEFTPTGLLQLYDRFLVSWGALFVRLTEALPRTTLSLWRSVVSAERGRSFRIWRTFRGNDSPHWLPRGLSTRYLDPNLIDVASRNGHIESPSVIFEFGGIRGGAVGQASVIPKSRRSLEQLPMFGRNPVFDEPDTEEEIGLFLSDPDEIDLPSADLATDALPDCDTWLISEGEQMSLTDPSVQ